MLRYHCKACNKKTTLDLLIEVGTAHNNKPIRICKPSPYRRGEPYSCNIPKWREMYEQRIFIKKQSDN